MVRIIVLTLRVMTPVGSSDFHRAHLRPLETTDICITVHNSSKISYKVATDILSWVGRGPHNTRNFIKPVENVRVKGPGVIACLLFIN